MSFLVSGFIYFFFWSLKNTQRIGTKGLKTKVYRGKIFQFKLSIRHTYTVTHIVAVCINTAHIFHVCSSSNHYHGTTHIKQLHHINQITKYGSKIFIKIMYEVKRVRFIYSPPYTLSNFLVLLKYLNCDQIFPLQINVSQIYDVLRRIL